MSVTSPSASGAIPRVVIVGAGFGGLAAAKALRRAPVEVILVDQHNHHVFTPFLYQVATALLEPSEVAQPVRSLIRRSRNVTFRVGRVTGLDLLAMQVETDHGPIAYDYLVLAAGSVSNYFHNTDIATRSLGLNDLADALQLRNQILSCFEQASWATDPAERAHLLSFAVVGGGPTGVEFAAALAVLVAGMSSATSPPLIATRSASRWSKEPTPLSVRSRRDCRPRRLRRFRPRVSRFARGYGGRHRCVGPGPRRRRAGRRGDRRVGRGGPGRSAGRRPGHGACEPRGVPVGPALQLVGRPEVFVVGDLAEIPAGEDVLPMLAQVAIQSGRHAARSIVAQVSGREVGRFHYRDLGTMATVGRNDAVAQIGPLKLSGFVGWLAWLLVHIMRTVGLQARASVVLSWISGYLFADRPVRLITGPRQGSSYSHHGDET